MATDRLDAALAYARKPKRGAAALPPEGPADQLAIEAVVWLQVAGDAVVRALRLVRVLQRTHGHHAAVEAAEEFLRATELSLMHEGSHVCSAELHLDKFLGRVNDVEPPAHPSPGSGDQRRAVAERRRGRTTGGR